MLVQLGGQSPHDPKDIQRLRVKFCKSCVSHMLQDSTLLRQQRRGKSWFALDSLHFLEFGWLEVCVLFRSGGPAAWHVRPWHAAGSNRSRALTHFVENQVRPRLGEMEQALLRSQGGRLFGVPLFCCLTSALARFDSALFWVLFLPSSLASSPPSFRNLPVKPSLGRVWSPPHCGGCELSGFCVGSQPEFAVRQEQGWALTFWFVIWIWCRAEQSPIRDGSGRTSVISRSTMGH